MDYLDPNKKKVKRRQLLIMYILLGIAISIATVVVVYNVNGYSIDRETGQVVQNGLLYIDTKPESAEVTLNGERLKGRTDARLVLEEGAYDVQLTREGYQPWRRNIILEGGSLRRLTYARLVPETIDTETTITFDAKPTLISQSIDKRWVVINSEGAPLAFQVFDTERPQATPFSLQLPTDFLQTKEPGEWRVIDWADDNKTLLASYTTTNGTEFALLNREGGTKARNITKQFPSVTITSAELRARKNDSLYIYSSATATVSRVNVNESNIEQVLAGVVDYKSYGDNSFLYITEIGADADKVRAVLQDGEKEYTLRELTKAEGYLLDISKLGNAFVVGVGSPVENRIVVFNDPIHALSKNTTSTIPVPTTVLRVENPTEISISADSSIIMARGKDVIASHEFEADRSYNFSLAYASSDTKIEWLDGQHLLYKTADGGLRMLDFDGSNNYLLVAASSLSTGVFNRSTEELYAITKPTTDSAQFLLTRHYLRSGADR